MPSRISRDARSTLASLYGEMNLLDGRLLHELRLLVGAVSDARKEDKTVPAVKCRLIKSGKRKKAAATDAATTAAAETGTAAAGSSGTAAAAAVDGDKVGNG